MAEVVVPTELLAATFWNWVVKIDTFVKKMNATMTTDRNTMVNLAFKTLFIW